MEVNRFEIQLKLIIESEDEVEAEELAKMLIHKGIVTLMDEEDMEPVHAYDVIDILPAEVDIFDEEI